MLPKGSLLVFGPTAAPTVHILSESQLAEFYSLTSRHGDSAKAMRDIYRKTFGQPDACYALPAWSEACMLDATRYEGPQATMVRGIAAAIVLGRPFGADAMGKGGQDDSGQPARLPQPKPRPAGPGAAAKPVRSALAQLAGQR